MKRLNFILLAMLASMMLPVAASADESKTCTPEWYAAHQKLTEEIAEVVLNRLTLYVRDGETHYTAMCSLDHFSCEQRIHTLADMVAFESMEQDVDPWLITSVMWNESRWNPFVVSRVGARGVMQLHPLNSRFNDVEFLHSGDWYRTRCKRTIGYCQEQVIHEGVALLKASINRCDNNILGGLNMYASGKCDFPGNRYSNRALVEKQALELEVEQNRSQQRSERVYSGYRHNRC